TPASIYSALQRARKATEDRLPDRSQRQTRSSLSDDEVRHVVDRFMQAWEAADVDQIRALLTDDCALVMPPWAEWFRGRDAVLEFLPRGPWAGDGRWKLVPTSANGQPALAAYYALGPGPLHAEGIIVLSLDREGSITEITSFRDADLFP